MINEDSLVEIFAYVKALFNTFTVPKNNVELKALKMVWLKHLERFSLDIIYVGIDEYAKNNQFVNIAQIAELCRKAEQIEMGTFKDAYYYFNEISRAISYSSSRENFARLSNFSKDIVRNSAMLAQWSEAGENFQIHIAPRIMKQIQSKLDIESIKERIWPELLQNNQNNQPKAISINN